MKEGSYEIEGKPFHADIAQRTAGSHSPIDVIGIDTVNRIICLVQCKPESMSEAKKEELIKKVSKDLKLNKNGIGLYFVKFVLD
jgi:hypothetical protein